MPNAKTEKKRPNKNRAFQGQDGFVGLKRVISRSSLARAGFLGGPASGQDHSEEKRRGEVGSACCCLAVVRLVQGRALGASKVLPWQLDGRTHS